MLALVVVCNVEIRAGSATVAWDANSEPDIAGYTVYWGLTSGDYDWSAEVGKVTSYTVANLQDGQRYYFALQAINQAGLRSPLSVEASAIIGSTTAPTPVVSSVAPASGPTSGATPITIAGTGFLAGATVALGGVSATNVTVASATTIAATTAAHAAGAVSVVVTNPDGQSGTRASAFTYVAPAPPRSPA